MADILATPAELALFVDQSGLDEERATLLLELSTAEVQAAAGGQRIVEVADDPFEIMGTTERWVMLPQLPVTAAGGITIDDGDELVVGTDYKRFGAGLWRRCGWSDCPHEPTTVAGINTHGYALDNQRIMYAKSCAIGIARVVVDNPGAVLSESIDDYRVQYAAQVAAVMEASPFMRKQILKLYGVKAGPVRVSG